MNDMTKTKANILLFAWFVGDVVNSLTLLLSFIFTISTINDDNDNFTLLHAVELS
jgi:hypothetical protein